MKQGLRGVLTAFAGAALVGAGLLVGGCRHTTEVVPSYADYFPLAVGSYRSYVVQDSTWTAGKLTASQYQVREAVTEQFADAAGQPAYRLTRARRLDATQPWADDSLLVVQPLARALLLTRSNLRTVELIYPPAPGKAWNQYAFTVNSQALSYQLPDTITNLTRRYGPGAPGSSFSTPAAGPAPAASYPTTVTVLDEAPVALNDGVYRRSGYQQVFALGVGPVLRRRYYYQTFTRASNGAETATPGVIQNGTSRRETLLETGKL